MTQTDLPRRPWSPLPPPVDGLADVRRVARLRRRRRAIAVAAVGSGTAAVVAIAALAGGSGGLAVLKTVTPADHSSHASPGPASKDAHGTLVGVRPRQPGAGGAVGTGNPQPSSMATAKPATQPIPPGPAYGPLQPQMVRTESTYTGAPRVCQGTSSSSSDDTHVDRSFDWCLDGAIARTASGVRLTVVVCRDGTGAGTLTFDTTQEADVTVTRNGTTVWDWARANPASSDPHSLSADANGCFDWSVVWPDTTQSGAAAGHGTFTFVATSYAHEVQGVAPVQATFSA